MTTPSPVRLMTIPDLIKRLEAAEGADREMDAEIGLAVSAVPKKKSVHKRGDYVGGSPVILRVEDVYPRYTHSIDAALTLVLEGYVWQARNHFWTGQNGAGYELQGGVYLQAVPPGERRGDIGECCAKTVPLAICIACLKARLP